MSGRSLTRKVERALKFAAVSHAGQVRRGSEVPYCQHVVAVAWILDRLGYPEEVVIAGLLHDVVEDTHVRLPEICSEFGDEVATLVGHCSEVKLDEQGRKRPWIDRKRDHLAAIENAPADARAILLADKLHNLMSIESDLIDGVPIWDLFHAPRVQVLWYYRSAIDTLGRDDPRLEGLAVRCREILTRLETMGDRRSGHGHR